MRLMSLAAVWSFLLTFGAVHALRADSPTLALAALAGLVAAVTWFATQSSDATTAGTTTTGTAATLTLTITGRSPLTLFLPLVAAQAVGAVAAGALAVALPGSADPSLAWREPTMAVAIAMGLLIGLVGGWLTAFIDGYLTEGVAAIPVLLAGGFVSLGYALAYWPTVLIGLAVAGLTTWFTSLLLIASILVGTAIAGYSLRFLLADPSDTVHDSDA